MRTYIITILLATFLSYIHIFVVYFSRLSNNKQKIITSIGGGILSNAFLEELPKKSLMNIKWFLISVICTTILIFISLIFKYYQMN